MELHKAWISLIQKVEEDDENTDLEQKIATSALSVHLSELDRQLVPRNSDRSV